jgi:hypothetical protein
VKISSGISRTSSAHQWFPDARPARTSGAIPGWTKAFNTFADYDVAEAFFKGSAYGDTVRRELLGAYTVNATAGSEQPMITKPDEVAQLYWNAYQKPALMLTVLRDAVLGPGNLQPRVPGILPPLEIETPAAGGFLPYHERRHGPRSRLVLAQLDLYDGTARSGVDDVRRDGDSTFITLSNRGQMVLPVQLELRYGDGTTERRDLPVENVGFGRQVQVPDDGGEAGRRRG